MLIGAGFFAAIQAEAWRRIPGVEIVAVADPLPGRAETFATEWGIPRAFGDAAEMLAAVKPDFVDIASRPETHLTLTRIAAAHGAHVICQKPMAPTWEDCLGMVRACEDVGVRLIIHENWRWQPWYREIRCLLDSGVIGCPFHLGFQMRTGDGRGPEPYPVQPYFREMERFLLHETAVHFLDTFRYLLGEIASVYCQTARINPAIRGEDYALVQLAFRGGAHGLIDANRISGPLPPPVAFGALRLEGDRGVIRLSEDGRLGLAEYGQNEISLALTVPGLGYKGDSVRAAQEHYVHCLGSGTRAETEGDDYLKTVAAVIACYRSAETGQAVTPVTVGDEG